MTSVPNQESTNGVARSLAIDCQDEQQNDAWDAFVESLPDGHHEQTSLWGQVRAQNGWEISRVLIREKGEILAGAQMQTRFLRRIGKIAYVTYGPCLRAHDAV